MLAAASPLLSTCSGETQNPKTNHQTPPVPPCSVPASKQQENMLGENAFWHDVTVNGYQSRRFAETGDLDAVWASIRDSRDKVCVCDCVCECVCGCVCVCVF